MSSDRPAPLLLDKARTRGRSTVKQMVPDAPEGIGEWVC